MMTSAIVEQLRVLGAPDDVIEAAESRTEAVPVDDAFLVWPENWTAFQLFRNLGTQWDVVAGMGGIVYIGLKYGVVEGQMDRLRIPAESRGQYWDDLDLMERAALPLLNQAK